MLYIGVETQEVDVKFRHLLIKIINDGQFSEHNIDP